jgi:integrase
LLFGRPVHEVRRVRRAPPSRFAADEAGRRADALPDGFPFVYQSQTGIPIRHVLLYILRRWRQPKAGMKTPKSLNTAQAQAYDICDFLEHLDAYGLDYDSISQEIFDKFAENLSKAPSHTTGLMLSNKTVSRRLAHVASFLRSREFLMVGNADVELRDTPTGGRLDDAQIHPLTETEWKKLIPHLGPLPSERKPGETSILRLIAEWAVLTGVRRVELANLQIGQMEEVIAAGAGKLTVDVTKGGIPRPLWLHPDIVRETSIYMNGERAEVLAACDGKRQSFLFVNPRRAGRFAGEKVRPDTISKWFRSAVLAAGLLRRPVGGHPGENLFVFHDLRHTFAVWTYRVLEFAGRKRPSKIVQARLGHKNLHTTESIYLTFIEDHEIEIGDQLRDHLAKWDMGHDAAE